jgi:hypothetical protein
MSSVSHSSNSHAIDQGSNSVNVRLFNERVILNALRRLIDTLLMDFSGHVLGRGRALGASILPLLLNFSPNREVLVNQ